ncbi:fatty-acyl-CoA synthase [Salibacterium salarium]|uniref:AMP-binding protein n=1 Tax=Salibacterium salarium TaxID=284579 RepID=UPI00278A08EA|nr:AMP-binding protein [Salibacterium salarium]MDQ0299866.1 fatty-acyl-CoA synthase [Salibacterium salarium]
MFVPLVLTDFLDRAVSLYGNKTAVIDGQQHVTYSELNQRVNQLSHGLNHLQVKKGDKVAYLTPNSLEMLEGFFGVFQVGGIMTPLDTNLEPMEYAYILNHSESKVLFVEESLYSLISPAIHEFETVETIIVIGSVSETEEYYSYNKWIETFPKTAFDRIELEEGDIATLLYTRGTTGTPKGVLLTHRSNYLHAMSAMHHLKVTDRDCLLHMLPMYHVNGWGSPFYYTANGATQVMQKESDPEKMFENIHTYDINVIHMTPPVLGSVLTYYNNDMEQTKRDVRVVVAGSVPPQDYIVQVEDELGWEFIQVYGMTEMSPLVTISQVRSQHHYFSKEEKYVTKAKIGYPMIGSDVRVADKQGHTVPFDGVSVGEIVVRSNNAMDGYLKNPEATSEMIKNGWLHTGDMAVVDTYGYIQIVERKQLNHDVTSKTDATR